MRLLLDTHILLWVLDDSERLGRDARRELADKANEVFFSAVSILEIAIKASLGRAEFGVSPREIIESATRTGFTELPVNAAAASLVADFPLHHRDPFDRLLIAQAISLPAQFYTMDRTLRAYSDLVTIVG